MSQKVFNKTEGDINLTDERKRWQKKFLSEKSKKLLEEDEKYFIHQALSTPCLDTVAAAEGIYITDEDEEKSWTSTATASISWDMPILISLKP